MSSRDLDMPDVTLVCLRMSDKLRAAGKSRVGAALAVHELAMIDELIDEVARAGSLTHDQATLAVRAMIRFMAARLPSPLFGELQTRLHPLLATPDDAVSPRQRPASR